MSRVFVGVAYGALMCDVYVEQDGRRQRLTRGVQRVHEGYRWDQAGPHSTELARAILWIVTGVELPWTFYRGFACDVLANLPVPPCEGECWRLNEVEVRAWLNDVGWTHMNPQSEHIGRAGARQQPVRTWLARLGHLDHLFRKRVSAGD